MTEVKAIEREANKIAELMQGNLLHIANDLKASRMLGDEDYDTIVNNTTPQFQRANYLLQRVITQVKTVQTQYQVFYDVLEKHLNPDVLARILPKPGERQYYAAYLYT